MKRPLRTLAVHLGSAMLATFMWPTLCLAGPVEQTTLDHLSHLRSVQATADESAIARYNQQMDEAWRYFSANKAGALPVLREQLAAEVRKPQPNSLILLDVGYFLQLQDAPQDKDLSKSALLTLDPTDRLVQWNIKELFEFTHLVAASHDARILPFIDKAFLRGKATVFIPQHSLTLDETLVCVFLYGVYGDGSEQHLRSLLADTSIARKVIEILIWVGSPDSVPDVSKAFAASPDYENFSRMTAFMMKSGGPLGRAAMLATRVGDLDARTHEYYAKLRPAIESTNFDSLRKQFGAAGTVKLSEEQVKVRLAAMNAHNGSDDSTQPIDILNSTLSRDFLIRELVAIRAKSFLRLSDEALSDVEMTNALTNALRYRKS